MRNKIHEPDTFFSEKDLWAFSIGHAIIYHIHSAELSSWPSEDIRQTIRNSAERSAEEGLKVIKSN